MPTATEHIPEQIELIKTLERKGYTYATADGIYFDTSKLKHYGRLAQLHVSGLQAGKRVAAGAKRSKTDFALWKFSARPGERQQEWPSPWGVGYPGWHIECSAMAMKYLGASFDIHTGGQDHIPIHHTNEIAQSEAATGKPYVKYWLHGAFLNFKGEKVSKSKGGLYTVTELEQLGYSAMHLRYLYLLTHYRKPLNFTLEHLTAARAAYERLKRKAQDLQGSGKGKPLPYKLAFERAINNDLNMPEALQALWKMLDSPLASADKLKLIKLADTVLGLQLLNQSKEDIPASIYALAHERQKQRQAKDWGGADTSRALLFEKGYNVEDTPSGQKISKRSI